MGADEHMAAAASVTVSLPRLMQTVLVVCTRSISNESAQQRAALSRTSSTLPVQCSYSYGHLELTFREVRVRTRCTATRCGLAKNVIFQTGSVCSAKCASLSYSSQPVFRPTENFVANFCCKILLQQIGGMHAMQLLGRPGAVPSCLIYMYIYGT